VFIGSWLGGSVGKSISVRGHTRASLGSQNMVRSHGRENVILWLASTFDGACIASAYFVVDDRQRQNTLKTYRPAQRRCKTSELILYSAVTKLPIRQRCSGREGRSSSGVTFHNLHHTSRVISINDSMTRRSRPRTKLECELLGHVTVPRSGTETRKHRMPQRESATTLCINTTQNPNALGCHTIANAPGVDA